MDLWTMSDMVKYRAAILSFLKLTALYFTMSDIDSGLSSPGVPGVPWHTQILVYQLTLFQPVVTDYAYLITNCTPGFSDLPTALIVQWVF